LSDSAHKIEVGDTVGLTVAILDKDRQIVDRKVMVKGVVLRIYQYRIGSWYRVDMDWENNTRAFLYSGKVGWAWLNELTLVRKRK
jgi:hypothetical protein